METLKLCKQHGRAINPGSPCSGLPIIPQSVVQEAVDMQNRVRLPIPGGLRKCDCGVTSPVADKASLCINKANLEVENA